MTHLVTRSDLHGDIMVEAAVCMSRVRGPATRFKLIMALFVALSERFLSMAFPVFKGKM